MLTLLPWQARAAEPTGSWVGPIARGCASFRSGGLQHILADGSVQNIDLHSGERGSCRSVTAMETAPDGSLWQLGNHTAAGACPSFRTHLDCPSFERVAGNPRQNDVAPGYGDFTKLLGREPRKIGRTIGATLTRVTSYGEFQGGGNAAPATPRTTLESDDDVTGHNVPCVFWNYMRRQLADWLFIFGPSCTFNQRVREEAAPAYNRRCLRPIPVLARALS